VSAKQTGYQPTTALPVKSNIYNSGLASQASAYNSSNNLGQVPLRNPKQKESSQNYKTTGNSSTLANALSSA